MKENNMEQYYNLVKYEKQLNQEWKQRACVNCQYSYYLIKGWKSHFPETHFARVPICFKENEIRLFNKKLYKWQIISEIGKLLEKDGKFYRWRRGELVQIPEGWYGKITHENTIRKRKSKKGQGKSFKRKCIR